ncbi:MAG: SDR family NAD(P)-dependent oxidoreductase, partial [Coriobacteriales bacterium]|nr:SDR family NAD(P)-dependent oxidoreductase [Coriobacteriales bacterium]
MNKKSPETKTIKTINTTNVEIIWQVTTATDAEAALKSGAKTLILKGAESAGLCGEDSVFILFQKVIAACQDAGAAVLIQGGIGVHTAAAYIALGAAGVILDSQLALFPECSLNDKHKAILSKLSGNEIRDCQGFHYYVPLELNTGSEITDLKTLYQHLGKADSKILPLGQDIILATDLVEDYKNIKSLVRALKQAFASHIKQARIADAFASENKTARYLGTKYPITQGPMARISDEPAFLRSVSDAGALPFLALSMMTGKPASDILSETAAAMEGKPWGVGILGFIYPDILEEQTQLIIAAKPTFVLIAGGRPEQGKAFERAGIGVLMHAPTPGVLDMFLKAGQTSTSYIFEGRESGGHDGPLYSTVLWEKQVNKILNMENPLEMSVFFAGGIHDAISSLFIRVLAAPLTARGIQVGLQCGTAYLYTKEAIQSKAITENYQKQLIEKDQTVILQSGGGQDTRCIPSQFTDLFFEEKARLQKEGLSSGEVIQKLEDLNLGRLRVASKGLERVDDQLVSLTEAEQIEKGLFMTGAVTELMDKVTSIKDLHENLTKDSSKLLSKITIPGRIRTATEASARTGKSDSHAPDTANVAANSPSPADFQTDIAVIGMAGIFPKAANVDEFWRNILFGTDCITEVPENHWSTDVFYDPKTPDTDHVLCKWGGFIDETDFDVMEFGITPQSMTSIEGVQLLSLLVAKRALEDAGLTDLTDPDLEETAVIFGAQGAGELTAAYNFRSSLMGAFKEMPKEVDENLPRMTEDSFAGFLSNVIAGRISNRLNTRGNNYTVDAACASSLAALDIAVSELQTRKAGMVVLGGADLHNSINDFQDFGSTHALSKNGRCATFDANADGIVIAEGIGAVILKRLKDAKRDGNNIYAVIKGIGGSSDGKSMALTAPSKDGQILALQRAYRNSGISPSEVGLVEPHGTGTVVGDRIELQALSQVYWEDGVRPGNVVLSSLKSQIGHTKCAAGIASLIKAVHCVRHGILPPTKNLQKPNKVYTESSPFAFRTEKSGYWPGGRRIAGVSGFGFGGTNFHAVIQNYEAKRPEVTLKSWPAELFLFPGDTPAEAEVLMDKVHKMLELNNSLRLVDIAYSLAVKCSNGNEPASANAFDSFGTAETASTESVASASKPIQYAIVAATHDELLMRINKVRNDQANDEDGFIQILKPVPGKVAFLFPGQGSQRVNMAADLFNVFPRMRSILDSEAEKTSDTSDTVHVTSVYEQMLFPHSVFTEDEKKAQLGLITDTRNAQPLLGIVDLAIAELLRDFGVQPDVVAGHSYGELPALCFAGAIAAEDLVSLSCARAESILAAAGGDKGRMAAVLTDQETLAGLLEGMGDVWAVNYNAPRQTVVAATDIGMDAFLKKAKSAKVACNELNVACAFHSPLLKGADVGFANALKEYRLHKPELPAMSNIDSKAYPTSTDGIRKRLANHLVSPVHFTDEVENMHKDGVTVFIEAGPGRALTTLVSEILKGQEISAIQTERTGVNGLTFLLQGLAKYVATGRTINIDKLFRGRDAVLLDVDVPENSKKNGLIWNIDGRSCRPDSQGSQGTKELDVRAEGLRNLSEWLRSTASQGMTQGHLNGSGEEVVLSYLANMNMMINDHRDVILGYLGTAEITPRSQTLQFGAETTSKTTEPTAEVEVPDVKPLDEDDSDSGLLDIPSMTTDQISEMIFEIVSEKTGYPVEMLTLDTDLEADLSIDSIKKMEIIGGLRSRVKMPENDGAMEAHFEKIIAVRKFRDLTAWVEELGRNESGAVSSGAGAELISASIAVELNDDDFAHNASDSSLETSETEVAAVKSKAPDVAGAANATDATGATANQQAIVEDLTRLTYVETAFPLTDQDQGLVIGKTFAVTNDGGGLADAVVKRLTEAGAAARIIDVPGNWIATDTSSTLKDLHDCDGLIMINSAASMRHYAIMDLFSLLKAADMDKLQWTLVFDDSSGLLLASDDLQEALQAQGLPIGFRGLLKTLAYEYPSKRFCSLQFETAFDTRNPKVLADIVLGELTDLKPIPELFYRDNERFFLLPKANPLEANGGSTTADSNAAISALDQDSVVVVLGGAQGISPHLIAYLAKDNPCRYILVGRSVADPECQQYAALKSIDEIRQYLITEENMKQPREIEARAKAIFKTNQIAEAVSNIEKTGAKAEYQSVDVTNHDDFRTLLTDIKANYGRIDAVIHAAGILEDKLFRDKDPDSFMRVYDTKVLPLATVIEELLPDLKLLVLFSSMASAFGNVGQCDYAAGNSVFDSTARLLKQRYPELKAVAFDWGPWRGAGMVN